MADRRNLDREHLSGSGDAAPIDQHATPEDLRRAFDATVEEGERRLRRTWPGLFATGTVGGIDVAFGLLALLLVLDITGERLLAALAFGIGFMALALARSELFTENFLVPIAAVVAKRAGIARLLRLWGGTLATNLAGGWVATGLFVVALPRLQHEAVEAGFHYIEQGIGWSSFASSLLGGAAITLMTWMERATRAEMVRIAVAWATAFLLAAGPLNHSVIGSLEMFAALHVGAPFGYVGWLGMLGWITLGNAVGGIALVTILRFLQVGRATIERSRQGR